MRRMQIAFLFGLCGLLIGCTSVQHQKIKTGLFNDDVGMLLMKYGEIQPGKTCLADLERLGFRLDAPNIHQVPGAEAIKFIFGDTVFQGAVSSPEKLDELLDKLGHYNLIIIPHKDVRERTDRFYFSKKETARRGDSISLFIVLKDDLVVYRTKDVTRIDETEIKNSFGQGVLDLLKEIPRIPSW